MGLVSHAEFELRRAKLLDKDADYDGMVGEAVLELMKTFAAQGHSGGSALQTIYLFNHLARFKTLSPITSDPAEWNDVGPGTWQSRRSPNYFSSDGGKTWYCLDKPQGFWAGLRWHLVDHRRWKANAEGHRGTPR